MLTRINHFRTMLSAATAVVLLQASCLEARGDESMVQANQFSLTPTPEAVADYPKYVSDSTDDWHFVLRLGIWGMSADGDLSVGDRSADVSVDFSDLLSNTNFAFMPGFEIQNGKWVLALNTIFSQLEDSQSVSRTRVNGAVVDRGADVEMDMYVADLAAGYRLFDIPIGNSGDSMLSIIPAVGIRYTYVDLSINPDNFDTRSSDTELWDPYIGGRINWQFNRHLAWRTDASVGGFGVGSQFAWTAQTFLDWRFHKSFELNLGYRAMYWDYENGDLELDLTLHGPWVGLSIYLR